MEPGVLTMTLQLARRLIDFLPKILEFLSTFQGGLLGELLVLFLVARFLPPLIDVIFKIFDWVGGLMKHFEK